MHWLFSFFLVSLSLLAAAASIWSYVRTRKLLHGASGASLRQLQMDLADLTSQFESLAASHKKLASRYGMAAVRERRREETEEPNADTPGLSRDALRDIARRKGHRIT